MKDNFLPQALQNASKRIPVGFLLAAAMMSPYHKAGATPVLLGTANNFAVLAGSAISTTGTSVINGGNVGEYPGTSVGLGLSITPPFTTDIGNMVAHTAQNDLSTAFGVAAGEPVTQTLTGTDLGGLTLTPGVYFFATSAQLTGQLTLNDENNPDAQFVFQIGSTLTTASGSSVVTINAGGSTTPGISVFWQVGSSATLGTSTSFEGNILAYTSISDTGGSTVDGRLLAENGAVSLDDTTINAPPAEPVTTGGGGGGGTNVPDTGSTLPLLGSGLGALLALGRRFWREA
jgi:Ice-binding-like/VPDSG-CTERM motif